MSHSQGLFVFRPALALASHLHCYEASRGSPFESPTGAASLREACCLALVGSSYTDARHARGGLAPPPRIAPGAGQLHARAVAFWGLSTMYAPRLIFRFHK